MNSSTIDNRHNAVRRPILICTLGASWAVVPEAYALLAPDVLPLFQHHPREAEFRARVAELGLAPPIEVWVLTSGGTKASIDKLRQCWNLIPNAARLRIWVAAGTENLSAMEECARIRELTFRLCLHATEKVGSENVVVCLAGGRKTMSADLQMAGSIFGCAACFHVIDDGVLPEELRKATPEMLSRALPPDLVRHLFAVFLGPSQRADLADAEDVPPMQGEAFPISEATLDPPPACAPAVEVRDWTPTEPLLTQVWERRERRAASIFAGHIKSLLESEKHTNWYGLYRLPVRQIEHLRTSYLGPQHRAWLAQLPKADLHCHVGGVLDVRAQQEVARAVWDELTQGERSRALDAVSALLGTEPWPEDWSERLRSLPNRTAATSALLVRLSEEELTERLFAPTEPRIALRERHRLGFRAYELPGELSGSALLQREAAVREYARQVYRRLRREGVRYCELRGSPSKYLGGDAVRCLTLLASALREERRADPGCDVRFLVVADRRSPSLCDAVEAAVRGHRDLHEFVVGLDIAGDESRGAAFDELARKLQPAFEECLPITIHAGEGEPAQNIWESVYRLHAERIGHGLTLHQRPDLAARMRDRDIAVEMCPTSNLEVVGFRDPDEPRTEACRLYPLRTLWRDQGVPVVICTDNPGISRTTLSEEYLRAARMCSGLTLWEILSLIRTGFEHAFASAEDRSALLREADAQVIELIAQLPLQ